MPIVTPPTVVPNAREDFIAKFFTNPPQRDHVANSVTGLLICQHKTITGMTSEQPNASDQSCLNPPQNFTTTHMTGVDWDVQKLNVVEFAKTIPPKVPLKILWQTEFCKLVESFASYFGFGFLVFDAPVFQSGTEGGLFSQTLHAVHRGLGKRAAVVADLPAAGRSVFPAFAAPYLRIPRIAAPRGSGDSLLLP
jgi:hypothetical protein